MPKTESSLEPSIPSDLADSAYSDQISAIEAVVGVASEDDIIDPQEEDEIRNILEMVADDIMTGNTRADPTIDAVRRLRLQAVALDAAITNRIDDEQSVPYGVTHLRDNLLREADRLQYNFMRQREAGKQPASFLGRAIGLLATVLEP